MKYLLLEHLRQCPMLCDGAMGTLLLLCASNPLLTQDDRAAALVREHGIATFASKGEDA
jgi:S-adenosylhomocysteine hydrolase